MDPMSVAASVYDYMFKKRIAREADEADTSGAGGGAVPSAGPSGGGSAFDPTGSLQTDAYKNYRQMERMSLSGSKTFTDAEIKRGYRKL